MLRTMLTPCLLLMLVGAPNASALNYLAQDRFVSLEDVTGSTLVRVDSPDFEDFDSVLGANEVVQHSSLGADQITVQVFHDEVADPPDDHFVVESYFSTTFELMAPSEFAFQHSFAVINYITDIAEFFPWWDLQLILEASLTGPDGSVINHSFNLVDECPFQVDCSFVESAGEIGVLGAGTYTLVARSYAELEADILCIGSGCSSNPIVGSTADGLVNVVLFVPEPDRLLGLVAGMGGLACLGWARRRSLAARA